MKKPTKKPASAGEPQKEAQAQKGKKEEAQKPASAGEPQKEAQAQKGKKEEAQKPAGSMEKPIWEGKYTAIVGGRKYSRKAYYTAKSLGLALGECTEGAFWSMVHSAKTANGKAQARKRFEETKTLEDAKEGRKELAAKQKQAQALLRASKLWGDLEEAKSERKEYIALTKEHEEELFVASKVAKGYDEHSARALWEERQAKRAQREEARKKEAQAQAQKPASKPGKQGGKAPSKKAASRA